MLRLSVYGKYFRKCNMITRNISSLQYCSAKYLIFPWQVCIEYRNSCPCDGDTRIFSFISTTTTSISFIRTIIHCGTISSRSNPSILSLWTRQSGIHYQAERKYMAGYFYFILFYSNEEKMKIYQAGRVITESSGSQCSTPLVPIQHQ